MKRRKEFAGKKVIALDNYHDKSDYNYFKTFEKNVLED